jgi:1-deoxy-D-xylulose-5-phosphate reductoisomerase
METRRLAILGSTGSIGRSTLDVVIDHPGAFEIRALAAYSDIERLEEQYRRFHPEYLGVIDPDSGRKLAAKLQGESVTVVTGEEEIVKLAALSQVDMVVNAVVGAAGLRASLETIRNGKPLALANKESLVAGGPLFEPLMKKHGGTILPIDSEHSALWQVLRSGKKEEIRRLIITASGGPFRTLPLEDFEGITAERALDHPTWKMGAKITIDSASLTNKGLEVIEAVALFGVPVEQVSVVVHPQSIIHSMVEFVDSSVIAQLSEPDMRLPICYALFWPDRVESGFGRLDFEQMADLTFEPPDYQRFPSLKLAFDAARAGGTAPAVFNAANEVAVQAFLDGAIKFTAIADIQKNSLDEISVVSEVGLDDILEADHRARKLAEQKVGELTCC